MDPILTIVIPTFKNYQQLRWCLESMLRHTEYPYKIVVVNNGGPDDDDYVKALCGALGFEHLSVLCPGRNLAWMPALNTVLETCDTPFFCMMNDDVCFLPGNYLFWRTLMEHFNNEDTGCVGPCSNYVAGAQSLFQLDVSMMAETSLLIGFCKIVRTDLLRELGGLDESLPGGDDLDLSIRVIDSGHKLIVDRTAFLYHAGQQTGRRIHGNDWDSQDHQEAINNALIRKHGVKKWYRTFLAGWNHVNATVEFNEKQEHDWYDECLKNHNGTSKGLNIGCGDKRIPGTIGIDRRIHESGAGGQKFVKPDQDISGDASDLPVESGSCDYLIAGHIAEHLVDLCLTLKEWDRVLKPGGRLYMTIPDNNKLPTMILDHTHVHAFTPESMRSLLDTTGWQVDEIAEQGGGSFGVKATKREA
jgi:GT2 family glycosyltransferase